MQVPETQLRLSGLVASVFTQKDNTQALFLLSHVVQAGLKFHYVAENDLEQGHPGYLWNTRIRGTHQQVAAF